MSPSDGLWSFSLTLTASGTFEYFLQEGKTRFYPSGFIQVHPQADFPLHPRVCTLVSKWMGPMCKWGPIIKQVAHAGFNCIHWTPLQTRGSSNSPYSIRDQLGISPDVASSQNDLKQFLQNAKRSHGLHSITDIVWNHTAGDSPWLAQHSEAVYTPLNTPHLQKAVDLDDAIIEFSRLNNGRVLADARDVEAIIKELGEFVKQKRLWEYFVIDKTEAMEAFVAQSGSTSNKGGKLLLEDCVERVHEGRHGVKITDWPLVTAYYGKDSSRFASDLDVANLPLYQEYDIKMDCILENIRKRVLWERVYGPRLGTLSDTSPLVGSYFTRIYKDSDATSIACANNGWIWAVDPLLNFATHGDAYFLRSVIVWSDCVKLRYGEKESDSPWLWQHMRTYTRLLASSFDGFRIDNCHSTPLHVAQELLREARAVNPNLWVFAELFTGDARIDELFVMRLGINALVRESMAATSVEHLCLMLREYGGAGAFPLFHTCPEDSTEPPMYALQSRTGALLADCTHDNEMPAQRRSVLDALPNAAIVAFVPSAGIASTFGYDALLATNLDIVTETRRYPVAHAMHAIRRRLYQLHTRMRSFTQIQIEHDENVIRITRRCPTSGEEFLLVAHCVFSESQATAEVIVPCSFTPCWSVRLEPKPSGDDPIDEGIIHGLPYGVFDVEIANSCSLVPGQIAVFHRQATVAPPLSLGVAFVKELIWSDLNALLFRCEAEELDTAPFRFRPYEIPGWGRLPYAGIAAFAKVLKEEARYDPQHPLLVNFRQGRWAIDYSAQRLRKRGSAALEAVAAWIAGMDASVFPSGIVLLHEACLAEIFSRMSLSTASLFIRQLALGTVQLLGVVDSTGLRPDRPSVSLAAGLPHFATHHMRCWGRDTFISFRGLFLCPRIHEAALEHLCAFAGCCFWGLMPNLLDATRWPRYNARDATWLWCRSVQDYASLVDKDVLRTRVRRRFPIFNGNYVYCDFDDTRLAFQQETTIGEVLLDVLRRHYVGIDFIEPRAGPGLDPKMHPDGFHIRISRNVSNGFLVGGNEHNAGTWMDKMGDSVRAGNRGLPSTPRHGAPIEITALVASTLEWVIRSHIFPGEESWIGPWKDSIFASFDSAYFYPEEHARVALNMARRQLLAPLGMRTLDPRHALYHPNYAANVDTDDVATALGANYHNGPEWLWLQPKFFLSALHFGTMSRDEVWSLLKPHRKLLLRGGSPWMGLPELTNLDGAACGDSCPIQAWSMAAFLELAMELEDNK